MKKLFALLLALCLLCGAALAEAPARTIPETLTFAEYQVQFDTMMQENFPDLTFTWSSKPYGDSDRTMYSANADMGISFIDVIVNPDDTIFFVAFSFHGGLSTDSISLFMSVVSMDLVPFFLAQGETMENTFGTVVSDFDALMSRSLEGTKPEEFYGKSYQLAIQPTDTDDRYNFIFMLFM